MMAMAQETSPHGDQGPVDCASCHIAGDWWTMASPMKFNHQSDTDFGLNGAHTDVNCTDCHETLVFSEATGECASCHTDIHSNTVGNDCARCHNETSWLVDFIPELHEMNGFPLAGAHGTVNCSECHVSEVNLRFDRIGNECLNCHSEQYYATTSPNHQESNFSMQCADCHDPFSDDWSGAGISNHDFFPLVGGHNITDCTECHKSETYSNISADCVSCHQSDFTATTNPNHVASNFGTDCNDCHTIVAWSPANFNHDFFPLRGTHATTDCVDCHHGDFSDTPNTCAECHASEYASTTNPNHTALNFPMDCDQCHTEDSWHGATFDHSNYPLVGAHASVDCNDCHNGNYTNTPNTCIACHTDDYNSTDNPDHATANFSTDCLECHTQNSWMPSTFNHDPYFPIESGKHRRNEVWTKCTECHTTPSNYAAFSCLNCHEHRKSKMDEEHQGKTGYVYESTACLSCHPRGRE